MTSFGPWVYASCVQSSPQVINTVLGRTCPPSTSLSAWYSPSWPLRVRLNIDTPSLVGYTLVDMPAAPSTALVSLSYKRRVHKRGRRSTSVYAGSYQRDSQQQAVFSIFQI